MYGYATYDTTYKNDKNTRTDVYAICDNFCLRNSYCT